VRKHSRSKNARNTVGVHYPKPGFNNTRGRECPVGKRSRSKTRRDFAEERTGEELFEAAVERAALPLLLL